MENGLAAGKIPGKRIGLRISHIAFGRSFINRSGSGGNKCQDIILLTGL